ncbi:MAG TPA: spore coat protein CotH, partial [Clostridiales bacterium]|nr:spore coat protein CotH [Clostridiales bacterium]
MPEASLPGGYYENDVTLELNAPPYGKIYYTTDGSAPSKNSIPYDGGIRITDRSDEPNVYHSIQNVVKDWKEYTPDPTPVKKGTVIRAVYISDWGSRSEILTQTYFVGLQPPEHGYTLSLVFEDEDVFGEDGIYVTGKAYDAWY